MSLLKSAASLTIGLNVVSAGILTLGVASGLAAGTLLGSLWWVLGGTGLGMLGALSPRVALQWERMAVLRLGRFVGLQGPGLF